MKRDEPTRDGGSFRESRVHGVVPAKLHACHREVGADGLMSGSILRDEPASTPGDFSPHNVRESPWSPR